MIVGGGSRAFVFHVEQYYGFNKYLMRTTVTSDFRSYIFLNNWTTINNLLKIPHILIYRGQQE